jgi:hypothetical protein
LNHWSKLAKLSPHGEPTTQDQAAQQLWACAASNLRRFASPVNWRCKAREQASRRDQLILQTSDFWNLDWFGEWWQVTLHVEPLPLKKFYFSHHWF